MALSGLQERIALLAADLAEREHFALVGGAALIVHDVVHRPTADLDYFHPPDDAAVARFAEGLVAVLRADGLEVQTLHSVQHFCRLRVADRSLSTQVDIATDYQLHPAVATPYGPALGLAELGANKILAAFTREEPRDLVDLAAVTRQIPFEDLLDLAGEKDLGLDPAVLAYSMRATWTQPRERWPVDDAAYDAVRAAVRSWLTLLAQREQSGSGEAAHGLGPARR